jgi:4-hydroxy-tetrahydrodipicolinate synthase
MIQGSLVAIVTPMFADGQIDYDSYRRLVDWHIEQGTAAIVAVGTTGESPTVTVQEHVEIIRVTVEQARGRVPVIAGTGANSTAEAIELTKQAKSVGAAMTLQVVPYYNKPNQEGLFQHFKAIAEQGGLPVILYNVPGRTVADLHNDTVIRLAQLPNIIGIKDATGDLARGTDLLRRVPKGFSVLSGNDDSALGLILLGGQGVISVTANIAPAAMAQMCAAALRGDLVTARQLNNQLMDMHLKFFVEPNPVPLKWAMHKAGLIPPGVRLPLVPLAASNEAVVLEAARSGGVKING